VTQPDATTLRVRGGGRLRSVDMTTEEYPGFGDRSSGAIHGADDAGEGIAIVIETIFENRFMHAQDWRAWGPTSGWRAGRPLWPAARADRRRVIASDLRASASLVLAALAARGET